jgi:hypothetical protein
MTPIWSGLCPDAPAELLPPSFLQFHLPMCLMWLGVMAVLDKIFRRTLVKGAPWFALHCAMNAIVVLFGLRDVYFVLATPACAMVGEVQSWVPTHVALMVHVYHCVAYTDLRFDDILHHVAFVLPMGIMQLSMMWGPICNFQMFFITGLPGGLDYALLVLVKQGRLGKLDEKKHNSRIMVWLRMPGLLIMSSIQYVVMTMGFYRVHFAWIWVCMILSSTNGIFYMAQVHENYTINRVETASKPKLKIHERLLGGKQRKIQGDD